jgi:hypothetical protein
MVSGRFLIWIKLQTMGSRHRGEDAYFEVVAAQQTRRKMAHVVMATLAFVGSLVSVIPQGGS